MPLTPGSRIGPYEIGALLGAGGMGEVYRARDTRLDRTVAIKILPSDFATDPAARERFDREARAISRLDHPHICTLHDVGHHEGAAYLVMQYLEGDTLAARIARGPVAAEQALKIAIQIGNALESAHKQGIVHRDLKPGNVMLTKSGAKLLDFGLAKASPPGRPTDRFGEGSPALARDPARAGADAARGAEAPTIEPLTGIGSILGTLYYMAPEQVEGRDVDARADLWALGCVLYEMLTGRRPFEGQSAASTIAAILEREPRPLTELQQVTPAALDRVVRKCLVKDRDARWQTARDLADELRWITEATERTESGAATIPASSRRRERTAWGLAIVSSALAAATLLLWQQSRSAMSEPRVYRFQITTPVMPDPADFEVSPDGRSIAFVALNADKVPVVWVRPFAAATAQPVAGTEGATRVFWSPDSQSIGYAASREIRRQPVSGGTPRVVTKFAGPFLSGVWSGNTIVFALFREGLVAASADTGQLTRLTELTDGALQHGKPSFLPDGRRFLFSPYKARDFRICAAALDDPTVRCVETLGPLVDYVDEQRVVIVVGGVPHVLPFDASLMTVTGEPVAITTEQIAPMQGATAFARPAVSLSDGHVLAFRTGALPLQNLAWYDRKGQRLESVTTGSHRNFDLAPDGLRILTAGTDNAANVVLQIVDIARGVVSRVPTGAGEWANDPVWSPDGREVAYTQRTNRSRIVIRPVAGGETRTMFEPPGGDVWVEDWSRDGRFLAVGMGEDWMRPRIVLVPLDGGAPTEVPAHGGVLDEYHFSPDGRWLAYNSDASGRHEVYVTSLPPKGEHWQISSAGGVQARWRSDAREIYYIGLDGGLMAVAIGDGPTFSPSAPRRLFTLPDGLGSPILDEYAVSRDGQRFLILEPGESRTPSPIDIVVNWQALLKTK